MLDTAIESIEAWWKRLPRFWKAQSLGWGAFVLMDLADRQLIDRHLTHDTFLFSLLATLVIAPALVALSMGLRAIYAAQAQKPELTLRLLVIVVLSSVAASAVMVVLLFFIHAASGTAELGKDPLVIPAVRYFLAFAAWSLCYFWAHAETARQDEHRRALAAEAVALRAELEELRLQLDPHFLFNALNGVAAEIPREPVAALAMLRDLTAYLRHSLAGIHQTVVTVAAEVEGLSAYLRVQRARFGRRLQAEVDVDPAATSHRIASFLLQPLVENAVKYGNRDTVRRVRIEIRLAGNALKIEIENSGTLAPSVDRLRHRAPLGLENVRRRLALHYPGRHQFSLRQLHRDGEVKPEDNSVIATLVLEGEPCSGH
ncbi:Histidine kinase [Enhydrobacter aerosaccus]|uniref:Histidine kinase n=1 Tax=Enhydrobacter aerosaccus TaxID=225324 RepID=A0A1T4K8N9_9HYPH|nr:histidine kinase [Enhydrobacter aerosaccus]SJZ38794.1 Histidine kinase [Enhydrobacter aerosaccus]